MKLLIFSVKNSRTKFCTNIEKNKESLEQYLLSFEIGWNMGYSKASRKTKDKTMLHDARMLIKMASVDNLSVRAIASNSRFQKILYTEEL